MSEQWRAKGEQHSGHSCRRVFRFKWKYLGERDDVVGTWRYFAGRALDGAHISGLPRRTSKIGGILM